MPRKKLTPIRKGPLTKHYQDSVRAQIQAGALVQRLNKHALGLLPKPMTDSQIRAAVDLLRKVLPDLKQMELVDPTGQTRFVMVAVPQQMSTEEWVKLYGSPSLESVTGETIDGEFQSVTDRE